MSEEYSNPLLSLIKDQSMIDDLQYEEVVGELKRSNAPVFQVLQDFGIMKADDILHVMATYLGTEVVSLKDREISPELAKTIPSKIVKMYKCLPVGMSNGTVQVALVEPLDPARADEIHFAAKRDIQVVVADPGEIERTIERLYGQDENESFSEILKELGDDKDIAREVNEAEADAKRCV